MRRITRLVVGTACAVMLAGCTASVKHAGRPAAPWMLDLGSGVKLELAWIPPGEFEMGAHGGPSTEEPAHKVRFAKGFWMGRYEVTQEQWQQVMGSNPAHFKGEKNPVEQVSWDDCQEFLRRVNQYPTVTNEQFCFRLPSEAEWEYACRAGTSTAVHYGNNMDSSMANFNGNYPAGEGAKGEDRQRTVPAGSFPPNAWGLHDMHGNVWEWCEDCYHENYVNAPLDGSAWLTPPGSNRIARGGAWIATADCCFSSHRFWLYSNARRSFVGFRVVAAPR